LKLTKTLQIVALSIVGVGTVCAQTGSGTNFPTSGLVLFAKFSEGSGNTVADSSGNGHTGYSTNSPAWIPGVTDYALNFVSASQQSVGFGNLNLAGSNQCTFSMWMQKTSSNDIGLAALGCTSGTYNAAFLAWWTDGYVYGGVGSTGAYRYFYAPYVANTWVHFVMVYDGTQLQNSNRINIFINGVQATPSPDQSYADTPIYTSIGTVSTNFSLSWDSHESYESGRYDGVSVWNRVLSATEIQEVYSNAAAGPLVDTNPPTLTIAVPTAGQHMTNALATVVGTASDKWKVSAVWYQLTNKILTGGTWSLATTTNNYTNWTTLVTLAAGTNTMKVYAVDLGGNYSTTSSVSVLSSNTFKLQLNFAINQPLTSTGLDFTLQISSNLNGHVQVSTNLFNWATLTNFVGTNTTLNFRDPAATNSSSRFYRAVIP
jgi:hypothetical protein